MDVDTKYDLSKDLPAHIFYGTSWEGVEQGAGSVLQPDKHIHKNENLKNVFSIAMYFMHRIYSE